MSRLQKRALFPLERVSAAATMVEVVVVGLLVALTLTAYAGVRGAPWLPTPQRAVEAALDAAHVGPSDVVVDLGAGDGRVLLAAARRGARAVGYELSPFFWVIAWLWTLGFRDRVRVVLADGFQADLSAATVVFAFLRPATMPRPAATMNQLRFTRRIQVLSYAFPLPDWCSDRVLRVPGCAPLFIYHVPAGTKNGALQ